MRIVYFTHSLVSDWNHGNAHFLRGLLGELVARGHDAVAWEPANGWSRANLRREAPHADSRFAAQFPQLRWQTYRPEEDLERALDGADLAIVHEWTDPEIVRRISRRRVGGGRFTLLFHDTHHRAVSAPEEMAAYDLSGFDGVLAFGESLSEVYRAHGWGRRVWTWHEAADTRLFRPRPEIARDRDIVWVGNWGDDERTAELDRFLFAPAATAQAGLDVFGVRYPDTALAQLARHGARYNGWLANAEVPATFARYRLTVHVPRRFYVDVLPGVPTIRVFEALACGIPLVSAPWRDCEGLFDPGNDFLVAGDGAAAARCMRLLLADRDAAAEFAGRGLQSIRRRHTCAHRVDELMAILATLDAQSQPARVPA